MIATALLRYTTGFCIGNFYARGVGAQSTARFAELDKATTLAWERINFPLEGQILPTLITLPTCHGGFGLRRLASSCCLAFVAGAVAASEHFPHILGEEPRIQLSQVVDPWLVLPTDDVTVQQFPSVVDLAMRYLDNAIPERHGQRKLNRELDREISNQLKPRMSRELLARTTSAAAPHANAWMAPIPGADKPHWLSPAEWDILIRRRLCLPVCDGTLTCGNCLRQRSDQFGNHAVACMQGPSRWFIHNSIRDTVARICGDALLSPSIEPNCFHTQERPDVLVKFPLAGGGRALAVLDVAMTGTASNLSAAIATPGGAATAYEANKIRTYGNRAREINAQLVPLVIDDCGAWGASAMPFWRRVAARYKNRFDISGAKATTTVMTAVSSALMGALARALLSSVAWRPSFLA